jgi:hypothetical protein
LLDTFAQRRMRRHLGGKIGDLQVSSGQIDNRRQPCSPLAQQPHSLAGGRRVGYDQAVECVVGFKRKSAWPVATDKLGWQPEGKQNRLAQRIVRTS